MQLANLDHGSRNESTMNSSPHRTCERVAWMMRTADGAGCRTGSSLVLHDSGSCQMRLVQTAQLSGRFPVSQHAAPVSHDRQVAQSPSTDEGVEPLGHVRQERCWTLLLAGAARLTEHGKNDSTSCHI